MQNHNRLKLKSWRKICCGNTNKKKAEIAVLISDKMDFTVREILRDEKGVA